MSGDNQIEEQAIEEMARVIEITEQVARDAHCGLPSPKMYAKDLYWKGYRKQSEPYSCGHEKGGEWISVDERLPEEEGWYITYTNANGKSNGVISQHFVTTTVRGKKVRRWMWSGRISPWIVTHWMPLPEAPKMKGGAE